MKKVVLVFITALLSVFLQSQGIFADENSNGAGSRSPFLTFEENRSALEFGKASNIDYLSLTAVFYSSSGSIAIIDGKVLREGDIVDNKEIVKINPESVMLKDARNEYIIKIKGILEKDES